ncbi:unnamed protein product [Urochloa humidicola]
MRRLRWGAPDALNLHARRCCCNGGLKMAACDSLPGVRRRGSRRPELQIPYSPVQVRDPLRREPDFAGSSLELGGCTDERMVSEPQQQAGGVRNSSWGHLYSGAFLSPNGITSHSK